MTAAGLVLLVGAATLLVRALDPPRTNLAHGAKVTASSRDPQWPNLQALTDGQLYNIGVFTRLELNPWVQIDLGGERTFSSVLVYNRSDRAVARASDIIVEGSRDGFRYAELGRHPGVFKVWDLRFQPTVARFVRLRLPRRDVLHLREVEVYQ